MVSADTVPVADSVAAAVVALCAVADSVPVTASELLAMTPPMEAFRPAVTGRAACTGRLVVPSPDRPAVAARVAAPLVAVEPAPDRVAVADVVALVEVAR